MCIVTLTLTLRDGSDMKVTKAQAQENRARIVRTASALFREKWPVIESMARDGIKTGTVDDGVITLVMP